MDIGNKIIKLNGNDFLTNNNPDNSPFVSSLCKSLRDYSGMDEGIKILNNYKKDFSDFLYNPKNGSYRYHNYYVIPGMKYTDDRFEKNLKLLNRLGHCKTSAPDLIDIANSKDNRFSIIVYKLNDTEGGILKPLVSLKEVPEEKKKRFLDEQLALLDDTGLYNKEITDSYDYWYLTPDTQNIFVDSWSSLEKCNNSEEKETVFAKLKTRV